MTALDCIICGQSTASERADAASIPSNVRAFRDETFAYYRCEHCGSLHARDNVDLAHYYARYPFHNLPVDWRLHAMYDNYLKRLRRAGLQTSHQILDYGCGGGHFVEYLKAKGYDARGYDEYSAKFGDKGVLEQRYDCIVSQDVLEHVPSPKQLLDSFDRLTKPGALIALGTPNASAIDLQHPASYVHAIHAPYHRHIFARDALLKAGELQGWKVERFYPTMYTNTPVPFLNERFYLYYTTLTDGTLDAMMEQVRPGPLLARLPETLFWGCFGAFFSRSTDVMAMFRTQPAR
jgi:2-polyprenyl-3-methyl-5-hydroxy-6-metoxy-1,4-benzoquinol methylase